MHDLIENLALDLEDSIAVLICLLPKPYILRPTPQGLVIYGEQKGVV